MVISSNPKSLPRPAARAIAFHGNSILAMKRNNNGRKYVSLIGGRIEDGETAEQAVIREAHEETGLKLFNPRLVCTESPQGSWGEQFIFLCEYILDKPKLTPGSEEDLSTRLGFNSYEPCWYPLKDLEENIVPFRTEFLRREILSVVKNGFPLSVKRWTPPGG